MQTMIDLLRSFSLLVKVDAQTYNSKNPWDAWGSSHGENNTESELCVNIQIYEYNILFEIDLVHTWMRTMCYAYCDQRKKMRKWI